jgi:hypothetical protein
MSRENELQEAVNSLINGIEEKRLRQVKKDTYLKMAACMDLKSTNQIENCVG